MKKEKILRIVSGLCIGAGVGLCFGISMNNVIVGVLGGLGVGLCYAVAFSHFSK